MALFLFCAAGTIEIPAPEPIEIEDGDGDHGRFGEAAKANGVLMEVLD
jgi:hypothetical protein